MDYGRNVPLLPSFLKPRWDVVTLGRWAGVFVLGSAIFLGAWQAIGFFPDDERPPQISIYLFWSTLVSTGSFGVIIILLAELINVVRRDDEAYEEDGDGVREDDG